MNNQDFIQQLCQSAYDHCQLNLQLFNEYQIKRGLRNEDGTGILAGISQIGSVIGYERLEGGGMKPVEGTLSYRGYDIQELCQHYLQEQRFAFEEVAYLLLAGALPNKEQLEAIRHVLMTRMALSSASKLSILNLEGKNLMNVLAHTVLGLYAQDPNPDGVDKENIMRQALELTAKFPTIIAYAYHTYNHKVNGNPLIMREPKSDLSLAENFLYLLKKNYTHLEALTLDLSLILHAEHGGGNNSTFSVRVTSSSATDTYSAIVAGISSLKGPLHGGANIQAKDMFSHLKKHINNWEDSNEIDAYLTKILNKEAYNKTGLIYGIGHAVYTKSDPRALAFRKRASELAQEKGREKEFRFLERLEERAIAMFQKVKGGKTVSANIDFYSGFVYEMIALPEEIYTPLFAMARVLGWAAHRNEEILSNGKRIVRPAYKNVIQKQAYIPLNNR